MRATGHHEVAVRYRALGQSPRGRDAASVDEFQRLPQLQLLHVLGEVAARHPLMDVLVPGQRVEFLDPRLHIVAGHALALGDRVKVYLVDHRLVVGDNIVGDIQSERGLRTHHGDPQLPFEPNLVLGRPDPRHVRTRIP